MSKWTSLLSNWGKWLIQFWSYRQLHDLEYISSDYILELFFICVFIKVWDFKGIFVMLDNVFLSVNAVAISLLQWTDVNWWKKEHLLVVCKQMPYLSLTLSIDLVVSQLFGILAIIICNTTKSLDKPIYIFMNTSNQFACIIIQANWFDVFILQMLMHEPLL